jgi:hypothetical protein
VATIIILATPAQHLYVQQHLLQHGWLCGTPHRLLLLPCGLCCCVAVCTCLSRRATWRAADSLLRLLRPGQLLCCKVLRHAWVRSQLGQARQRRGLHSHSKGRQQRACSHRAGGARDVRNLRAQRFFGQRSAQSCQTRCVARPRQRHK